MRFWLALSMVAGLTALGWSQDDALESVPFAPASGGVSRGGPLFTRLTAEETRISFVHEIALWHPDKRLFHSSFACGTVLLGDVDQDGLTDVFITGGPRPNKLYLQSGNLAFVDVTQGNQVGGEQLWAAGGAMVDFDHDGDLDIYVCYYDQPNQLYVNQLKEAGVAKFIENAAAFGLNVKDASLVPAFCDYDQDGDLDLYLLTHQLLRPGGRPATPVPAPLDAELSRFYQLDPRTDPAAPQTYSEIGRRDYLFRNENGKRFTDVTAQAGLSTAPEIGNSATWWDFNEDGRPDLYIGNGGRDPDRLYENLGNGTFRDVIQEVLGVWPADTRGTAVLDANNDGHLDFIAAEARPATHFREKLARPSPLGAASVNRNTLFLNTRARRFQEAAYLMGVARTDWTWAVKSADLDQDGRQDLLFLNGAARNFNDAALEPLTHERLINHPSWDSYETRAAEKREQSLAFRNQGPLGFLDVSKAWGLEHAGMSYTGAIGDLDNDGDLDLIVSSLNEEVVIYRNDGARGKSIQVQLLGQERAVEGRPRYQAPSLAIVRLRSASGTQVRQLSAPGGFMDADESLVHFGLGDDPLVEELTVEWPSGTMQKFTKLPVHHRFIVTEAGSAKRPARAMPKPIFAENNALKAIRPDWTETDAPDAKIQPGLPHKLSRSGPCLIWGDANGDGVDDLFAGGSAGKPGVLFVNTGKAKGEVRFADWEQGAFARAKDAEDTGAAFLDADGDGDLDLYVASGGMELETGHELWRDRLYLNDGLGLFQEAPSGALPDLRDDNSCVAAADFDRDGDTDLFLGVRSLPGQYPLPADSRLLVNNAGVFTEAAADRAPGLLKTGLVTGAVWTDVDNDGWLDLAVAHEWGPLKIFRNRQGKLELDASSGLDKLRGWWTGLAAADLDGDGDIDLAAANWGLNTRYRATPEEPELLFYGDFQGMGERSLVPAGFENGICFPHRSLDEAARTMPWLRERFRSPRDWAALPISQIFPLDQLRKAHHVKATELRAGYFLNDGKGRFEFFPFERGSQIAPSFGVTLTDFNLDGWVDVFLAQNFSPVESPDGPARGGLGQLLLSNPAATQPEDLFTPVSPAESGLSLTGDGRAVTVADLDKDQMPDLIVSENGQAPRVFLNRGTTPNRPLLVRVKGLNGNPQAAGARLTLDLSGLPLQTAEIASGSGFLSSNSPQILFAKPANLEGAHRIKIRWPDGVSEEVPFAGSLMNEVLITRQPPSPDMAGAAQAP